MPLPKIELFLRHFSERDFSSIPRVKFWLVWLMRDRVGTDFNQALRKRKSANHSHIILHLTFNFLEFWKCLIKNFSVCLVVAEKRERNEVLGKLTFLASNFQSNLSR
jgi:hypothetical protein